MGQFGLGSTSGGDFGAVDWMFDIPSFDERHRSTTTSASANQTGVTKFGTYFRVGAFLPAECIPHPTVPDMSAKLAQDRKVAVV
jgi:hypothetical protein